MKKINPSALKALDQKQDNFGAYNYILIKFKKISDLNRINLF